MTEKQIQTAYFAWLELKYRYAFYQSLHPRSAVNAGKEFLRKLEGNTAGAPDILILLPLNGYHGLAIELKTERNYKIQDNQRNWIDCLNLYGYYARICFGLDSAIAETEKYFGK